MAERYQYQTLEYSDEIRLLRLGRSVERGLLTFQLTTARLTTKPDFEAVSYTWGSGSRSEKLLHRTLTSAIFITPNCEDTLESLEIAADMTGDNDRLLWVDAICIDQDSANERSLQVKLMGRIFEAASNTIAYIGAPDTHFFAVDHWYRRGEGRATGALRLNAQKLVQRPWFTRTWVIQEALLSPQITIQASTYSFPWSVLQSLGPYDHGLVDVRAIYRGSDDSTPGTGAYLRSNQLIAQRSKNRSRHSATDTAQRPVAREFERPINDHLSMRTRENVPAAFKTITVHAPLDLMKLAEQEDVEEEDNDTPERARVLSESSQPLHQAVAARKLRVSTAPPYDTESWSPECSPDILWGQDVQENDLPEMSQLDGEQTYKLDILPLLTSQNLVDFGNLFDLLCETQNYNCQDPRDKLFAVLSLFSGKVPFGLEADYSRSVEEIYTNISRFVLRYGVAKALSSARGTVGSASLPTWVTDWRTPFEKSIFGTPLTDRGSWFSGGSRSVAGFGTRRRRTLIRMAGTHGICIRGKRVSRLGQIMEAKSTERILTGSFEYGVGLKWLSRIGHNQGARIIQRRVEFGLVPSDTQPDRDVICVLLGFRVPYVLRPGDPWRLVGECYLPWIELGEEVIDIDWGHAFEEIPTPPLEDFIIY